MKSLYILVTLLIPVFFPLVVFGVPGSLTYQGRIKNAEGFPLEYDGVRFEFSITNPSGTCVLYKEISTPIDMRNSGGVFDVPIGTGTKNFPTDPSFKLLDAFDNSAPLSCQAGGTYSPIADDKRLLRVQFHDGSGWKLITPDNEIRTVPYAGHAKVAQSAQKLGNNIPADFILKSSVPLCGADQYIRHVAPLGTFECTTPTVTGNNVTGNISGNSAGFTGNLSGDVSGTQSATSVNKIKGVSVDMTGISPGKVLKYNGTSWAPADDEGTTGALTGLTGDVTSTGNPLATVTLNNNSVTTAKIADGSITSAKIADGTIVDGDISGGANIADTKLATIATAGKVSGSAITSGTIGGSTSINTSGTVTSSSISTSTLSTNSLQIYKTGNGNKITITAPTTLSPDYSLQLPGDAGSAGQILSTNGSGVLSWINPSSGSVTSVTATAPLVSTGGSTPVLSLNDSGVTTGTYSKVTVDAKGLVTAGAALSSTDIPNLNGDVTSTSGTSNTKVEKIQGISVSSTTPQAGQVLVYGSNWTPQYFGMGQLRSTVTGNPQVPASCSTADKTLTWSAITDSFACTSISIANTQVTGLGTASTKNFGTAAGNLVELDGTGKIPTSLLPPSASNILDGGNATGATVVVGTNDNNSLAFKTNSTTKMTIAPSGNVGIGTATPGAVLDIRQGAGTPDLFKATASAANGSGTVSIDAWGNLKTSGVFFGNAGQFSWDNNVNQWAFSSQPGSKLWFTTDASGAGNDDVIFMPHGTGKVGIGTSTPQSMLQIAGGVQIGADSTACAAGKAGTIRYNGGNVEYCNGTTWTAFAASGAGITSLNGLTANIQNFAVPGTTGTAPGWSSSGSAHTLNIPMANTASVTAGLISKAEYDTFNNKLNAVAGSTLADGKMWLGNASNQATAVTLSGDATLSNAGALTLANTVAPGTGTKITFDAKGRVTASASITAGDIPNLDWSKITSGKPTTLGGYGITDAQSTTLTSGKILVGDGTNVATPVSVSGDAALSNTGVLTLNTVPASKGGTGLTSLGTSNQVLGVNNAGTASEYKTITAGTGVTINNTAGAITINATGSGGTVTSITAGAGLTGGTITGFGTIGLGTELTGLNGLSTSGFVKRTGAGAYSTSSTLNLATDTNGILPIANGGTNSSATLSNNRLMTSNGGAIIELGALSDGQIVVGKNASAPQVVTLGGDATISNTGSLTIANNSINSAKIIDGSVGVVDLNFAGSMATNTGLVVRDGTQFFNKTCNGNETLVWSVSNGWICSSVVLTDKVGANTTNYLSKWNGSALVTSGVFENGGNVGIGTNTPAAPIHIRGPASVTSFTGTSFLGAIIDGANSNNDFSGLDFKTQGQSGPTARIGTVFTGSGTKLSFGTSNNYASGVTNQAMTIDPNGYVGIGTTSPVSKFDVYSSSNSSLSIRTLGTSANNQSAINMITKDDGASLGGSGTNLGWQVSARGNAYNGTNDNQLQFAYWNGSSWLNAMALAPSGNVGIGTTSPTQPLDIVNSGPSVLRLLSTANGSSASNGMVIYESSVNGGINVQDNLPLVLATNNIERMRIQAGGNVGIGTTAPGQKLTVAGTIESTTGGVKYPDGNTQTSAFQKTMTIRSYSPGSFFLGNGASVTYTASCVAGEIATGGGCTDSGFKMFYQMIPSATGYSCSWYNTSGSDVTITSGVVYVNCLK